MPRNRYTRVIRQEKELAEITLQLKSVPAESLIDVEVDGVKAVRRIRRKHNRRHKPVRFRLRADQQ